MTSEAIGRTDPRWRKIRASVLAASDICGLCDHPGSDSVDHVIPRALCLMAGRLDLIEHPANLRPAHHRRCPVCGVHCNRLRADTDQRARDGYIVATLRLAALPPEPAEVLIDRYQRKVTLQEPAALRSSQDW